MFFLGWWCLRLHEYLLSIILWMLALHSNWGPAGALWKLCQCNTITEASSGWMRRIEEMKDNLQDRLKTLLTWFLTPSKLLLSIRHSWLSVVWIYGQETLITFHENLNSSFLIVSLNLHFVWILQWIILNNNYFEFSPVKKKYTLWVLWLYIS